MWAYSNLAAGQADELLAGLMLLTHSEGLHLLLLLLLLNFFLSLGKPVLEV